MGMKRDCVGLARAEDKGALYVAFDTETGEIIAPLYRYQAGVINYPGVAVAPLGDYRWMTCKHDINITTAADWMDKTDFSKILRVANVIC